MIVRYGQCLDLPSLKDVTIGESAFNDCSIVTFEKLHSLETVSLGTNALRGKCNTTNSVSFIGMFNSFLFTKTFLIFDPFHRKDIISVTVILSHRMVNNTF